MSNIDTESRTKIQDSELHLGVVSGTLGGIGPITPGFGPKRPKKVLVRRSQTQILTDEQESLAEHSAWWKKFRKGGPKAAKPKTKPYLPTTRSKSAPGHPSPSKQSKAPAPRRTPAKKGRKRPLESAEKSSSRSSRSRYHGPEGGISSSTSVQPPPATAPTTDDLSVSPTDSEIFAPSVLEKSEVVPSEDPSPGTEPQVVHPDETTPEKQKDQLSSWSTSADLAPVQGPAPHGGRVDPFAWRPRSESTSSEPTPGKSPEAKLLAEWGASSDVEEEFRDVEDEFHDVEDKFPDAESDPNKQVNVSPAEINDPPAEENDPPVEEDNQNEEEDNSDEGENSHHSNEESNHSNEGESDGGSNEASDEASDETSESDMGVKRDPGGTGGTESEAPTRYFLDDGIPKWELDDKTDESYNGKVREGHFLTPNQAANQGGKTLWTPEQRWEFFLKAGFQPFKGKKAKDGKESCAKYQLLLNDCKLANKVEDFAAGEEEGEENRYTLTTVYLAVFVSDVKTDAQDHNIIIQQVKREHHAYYKGLQDQAAAAEDILKDFATHGKNDQIIRSAKERLYDYTKILYILDKTKTTLWNLAMRPSSQVCIRDHHAAMTLYHDSMVDSLRNLLHNIGVDYTKFEYDPKYTGAATEKPPGSKEGTGDFLGKIKVPDITLPKWDGKPVSWSKYWFIFSDLYHSNDRAPVAMKLAALESSLPSEEKKRLQTYQYNLDGYTAYIKDLKRRNESIEEEIRLTHKAKIQTLFVCNTGSASELSVGAIYSRLRAFQDRILEAVRGYENTGTPKKVESAEWFPHVERKLTGVERERWLSYMYLIKEKGTWERQPEFDHFVKWLEDRVEDLRSEYERGSVQQTIEKSYQKGGSGGKGKVASKEFTTHATKEFNTHATSFTRKPPPKQRKPEFKMEIPQRCPWTLNSGKRCNQSHAPASCDHTGWAPDQVWRTVYRENLCPVCLCVGHHSNDCTHRGKGPCGITVKGGKQCTYYHHHKLHRFPFVSLSQYQQGRTGMHRSGGQRQAAKPKPSSGPSHSVNATSTSKPATSSSGHKGLAKKKGGPPKRKKGKNQ